MNNKQHLTEVAWNKLKEDAENKKFDNFEEFFQSALKKFNVDNPSELSKEKKKEFFDYVDKNWKGDDEEKEKKKSD